MLEEAGAATGAKLAGRSIGELPSYEALPHLTSEATTHMAAPRTSTPFPMSSVLNEKLRFWKGPLWEVQCGAVVNSTSENLRPHSTQAAQIFSHAGPQLNQACQQLEGVKTGEAKLTAAGLLPAEAVVHTVGPRFSVKYKTAAENTLHMAYWQCLEVLMENKLDSIAFDCLHSEEKGYPREAGCHIALRTVRRFLEKFGMDSIETVAFVFSSEADLDMYLSIAAMYFPRDVLEEQWACANLPEDTGNEFGETTIPERAMSIADSVLSVPVEERTGPQTCEQAIEQTDANQDDIAQFANMTVSSASQDAIRQHRIEENSAAISSESTYMWYLNQATSQDLSDIRALNIVYKSGVDVEGRMVVTLITPTMEVDYERLLLYLILTMDPVTDRDYSLVLVCARGRFVRPSFGFLRTAYKVFNRKYKKNLKALYIVHPTFWIRAAITFVSPFISQKFWKKLEYIHNIRDLYLHIAPSQVVLPPEVLNYDLTRR